MSTDTPTHAAGDATADEVIGRVDEAICAFDTDWQITFVNDRAAKLLEHTPEELLGASIWDVMPNTDESAVGAQLHEAMSTGAPTRFDQYIEKFDRWFDVRIYPDKAGATAWFDDITGKRSRREEPAECHNEALEAFQEIATDDDRALDERIDSVLELGCAYLGLDIGILSAVDDTEYTVEQVVASDNSIQSGARFDLGETFCDHVVDSEELVAVTDAGNSDLADHPAYEKQGLRSYIGTPVVVDGERYGTLNFSQAAAREQPFTESDRTLVRLFAQWVGKELSRQQNKQRAAANRDRLRQIIDLLPQLVFAKDRDNEYILANQAIADAYGTTVEDVEGSTDADFVSSDAEAEQFREDDIAVMDSGEPKHIPEEPLTKADGETVMLQTIKIPYEPVDHDTEAVLGVATDITEMTEQRRELEATSQRLNVALEATDAGVWELNLETKEVIWTESMEQLFGLDPGTSEGTYEEFLELVHPDDVSAVQTSLEETTEDGDTLQVEYRVEQDDRTELWIEARAELHAGPNTPRRLVGIATDVTERKQRDAEIELQSAAMEVAMDGIAILDDDEYVYMNQAHADIFDYEPEELLGEEWRVLYDDDEIERLEAEVFPELADTGSWRGETVGRKRDGTAVTQDLGLALLDSGELICTNRDITAQKQREAELKRSREFIEQAQESASIGGWEVDLRTDEIRWTNEVYRIHGLPTDADMSVDRAFEFYHPDDEATLTDAFDRLVTDGESYDLEVRIETANDRLRWVRVAGDPQFNDDGEVIKAVGVTQEISERKAREQELERSREFIEQAQESASIGGWEVDLATDSLRWTDEVYRIHDLPTDTELDLETGIDFYHPDDKQQIETAFETLVSDGEPYDLELRLITAKDRLRWVRAVGDPQFDDDGTVVGAVGIFQDITERKERDEELREVKERLNLAVEGANLGVWDWDMETDAVTFNEQYASMLGFSLDELEPRFETWADRVHPADMPDAERALNAHIDGDADLYDCEHRMQTKAGDYRWIRTVGKVIDRDGDGTPTRAVGIHLDTTEEKESKLQLEEERNMFAEGPAVVFKWENADGWPVEYVSENVAETFGYTPDQLRSGAVPYTDLIHEDDLDRVTDEVAGAKADTVDRFRHDPYRMVTADGEIRWVTDNTKIIRTDGEVTHYLGYLIDITEQKRLEASLHESEQSVRELTSIAADTDREFAEKLDALLTLGTERLGLPYGFLNRLEDDTQHIVGAVGDHPDLQTGGSAPVSDTYCRKAITQPKPLDVQDAVAEGWGGDPAYERFDLGCYIGGTVTVDSEQYGTLCFADRQRRDHEFTDAERAFVELLIQLISHELTTQTVEQKLRGINDTAKQLMTTPERSQIASLAVESATSLLSTPLTGIWWYDDDREALVPADMADGSETYIGEQPAFEPGTALAWSAFESGEFQAYSDLSAVDKLHNDDTVLESEVIVPLGDHGVMCAGAVETQAFSAADLNLVEVLASTIEAALTRAERETALRETQVELKRSNEELEQFAYAASHDLQEPLRTVSSYLTLLERRYGEKLDEDASEFIEFAVDGADRMRKMIQALLAYSRLDIRGESFESVEVKPLLEQVTDSLAVRIDEADAAVSLPATAATVTADHSQLAQLFQNLIDNGIKYNTDRPEIDLSVRYEDEMVVIDITDDGIGMEAGQIDDIFEVFQRLHTREEFDGTGIGLSICRKIVDRHDGTVDVQSTPGEGSTFTITLPCGEQTDE